MHILSFETETDNVNDILVVCIREDHNNELWVGTEMGLYRVDIDKDNVTTVLPRAVTRSICVDAQNEVWISADTGRISDDQSLYRLDRNRNQFVLFTDPISGERIRNIFDIMEDDQAESMGQHDRRHFSDQQQKGPVKEIWSRVRRSPKRVWNRR